MPFIETRDQTRLFYRAWGSGAPVVFASSWSVGSDMWQYQMWPLAERGLRCIAYDRRGHGRSDDPGQGYTFDGLADDLATLLTNLDLHDVTLVGHSMGCNEIARYLTRHGADRIARVALLGTLTPYVPRTVDNPQGAPAAVLEQMIVALTHDRPTFVGDGAIAFFGVGSTWPGPRTISAEQVQWLTQLALQSSLQALIACQRALWSTDFRPDMGSFRVPTLIIHGEHDRSAPLELCGRPTAQAIAGSQLVVYDGAPHGLFVTHQERLNADLMAFIQPAASAQAAPLHAPVG